MYIHSKYPWKKIKGGNRKQLTMQHEPYLEILPDFPFFLLFLVLLQILILLAVWNLTLSCKIP